MIRWHAYISMLKEDGVSLETSCDYEMLADDGTRLTTRFLIRWVDGAALTYSVYIPDMNEPVSRRTLRQVANALRLPPEKYIFPDEMN